MSDFEHEQVEVKEASMGECPKCGGMHDPWQPSNDLT